MDLIHEVVKSHEMFVEERVVSLGALSRRAEHLEGIIKVLQLTPVCLCKVVVIEGISARVAWRSILHTELLDSGFEAKEA